MWAVFIYDLKMTEGDFGIPLEFSVTGATIAPNESIKLTIKRTMHGEVLIERDFANIQNNTFELSLTETESKALCPGNYLYSLDWYRNGQFLDSLIPFARFKVGDKA